MKNELDETMYKDETNNDHAGLSEEQLAMTFKPLKAIAGGVCVIALAACDISEIRQEARDVEIIKDVIEADASTFNGSGAMCARHRLYCDGGALLGTLSEG